MTGRINFTPEAEQQLNELDDWITKVASADIAGRFVSAILDHIDGILAFPLAGRARDDVRPGIRTSTCKKRTPPIVRPTKQPTNQPTNQGASCFTICLFISPICLTIC